LMGEKQNLDISLNEGWAEILKKFDEQNSIFLIKSTS
jgi:hypothetical protein